MPGGTTWDRTFCLIYCKISWVMWINFLSCMDKTWTPAVTNISLAAYQKDFHTTPIAIEKTKVWFIYSYTRHSHRTTRLWSQHIIKCKEHDKSMTFYKNRYHFFRSQLISTSWQEAHFALLHILFIKNVHFVCFDKFGLIFKKCYVF